MRFIKLLLCLVMLGCGSVSEVYIETEGTLVSSLGNSGQSKYIVVFNDFEKSVPDVASDIAREHAFNVNNIYQYAIRGFAASMSEVVVNKLRQDVRIKYVEEDGVAFVFGKPTNPGKPPKDDGGDSCTDEPAQEVPYGIMRVGAPTSDLGRTAWVIDTGIDLDNCDLNVDISRAVNFVSRGRNSADDKNGHGTHVAGTIAALDNAINVVGVVPGALVVPVRVLDSQGSGYISWVVAGIDYVAANASPDDVVNMSLGATGHFQSLHDAVYNTSELGIWFALSAGNKSDHASNYEPAHVNALHVFTVSAIDINDVFASFSNYGNPPIDYATPGVNVLSLRKGGGVIAYSGTSMSAPHVAGLLLSGYVGTDGSAINDPDGMPDPIAHH